MMNDPVARQINQSGKSRPISMIDTRSIYRSLFPAVPLIEVIEHLSHTEKKFSSDLFIEELLKEDWNIVTQTEFYVQEDDTYKKSMIILVKDPGYMIVMRISYQAEDSKGSNRGSRIIDSDYESVDVSGNSGTCGEFTFYYTKEDEEDLENTKKSVREIYQKAILPENRKAMIGIISSRDGEYYVKRFSLVDKTPEFLYPDLHYGDGFETFHKGLLNRIKNETKGLALLHGEPGTGKTQYIRVLLKELCEMGKSVLYAPPNLSASLTEPEMIEFISDWILESEKDCVLLIEDAEPLLEARNGYDGRTTGISNLLNMTDGLLNDILGVVVIATFNTEVTKIDPALLRAHRLIARKLFKKMPKDRAELLSQELGIELPNVKYPASLADFYGEKMGMQVLIHDVEESKAIGFNR